MLIYTDQVIEDIGEKIATHEPERGGALLGIPNSNLITCFIEDPLAKVTQASYFPSQELTFKVQNIERHHGLRFRGIIHSHPNGFNSPSGQDGNAFSLGLDINPRLSGFVAPIVTVDKRTGGQYANNELPLHPRGQLTSYMAFRTKKEVKAVNIWGGKSKVSNIVIEKIQCAVMPLDTHLCLLKDKLQEVIGEINSSSNGYLEINGVLFISETMRFQYAEIIILFPPDYPITKPFVLISKIKDGKKENTKEISFSWSFSYSGNSQLLDACGEKIISFLV